jgi:hypothetical protein
MVGYHLSLPFMMKDDEGDGLKFCKQLPSYCKVMVALNCNVTFKVMCNLICYFIHMPKVGC